MLENLRAALAYAALSLLLGCGPSEAPPPPPREVRVVSVIQRDQPIVMEMVGQTRGSADIPIRARVEGVVLGIHFTEGRRVEEGQLLYTIDPSPFQAQVVEEQGRVAEARTLLAKSKSDLERLRPLAEIKAISEIQLDGAVAQYEAALGNLQAAKAKLEQAEIVLGYTRIHAPSRGRMGISEAKVGEFVGKSPNPVVLNVLSLTDPVRVRFSIDERRYLRLARRLREIEGNEEEDEDSRLELILADGSIHSERGRVVGTDASVDPQTGTFTLEADFPNPDNIVVAGQFARVRAAVETVKGALLVPQRALSELQGLFRVFVVKEDGTIELRPIEVGGQVDRLQIVESGLSPGERIALDTSRLRDGMRITALPVELDETGKALESAKAPPEAEQTAEN